MSSVTRLFLLLGLMLATVSSLSAQSVPSAPASKRASSSERTGAGADPEPAPHPPHELLHATLWVQSSAEWRSLTRQAYRWAARSLDDALGDPDWTAALEQTDDYRGLPPAVILDVDETVLDNSFYEARLIRDQNKYSSETWDPWVQLELCPPVPGVVEFLHHAASRGVTIFYVTNRKEHLREATRNNLRKLGLPLEDSFETVLTRSEERDKASRRRHVARTHRILLLIGDNNGDFASGFDGGSPEERAELVERYDPYWGTRWIAIPNPMYGAWEGAVVAHDYRVPPETLLERKYSALEFEPRQRSTLADIRAQVGVRFAVLESLLRQRIVSTTTPYGYRVREVDPGTRAEAAGLQPGDVLLEWQGRPIRSLSQLWEWIDGSASGQPVKVKFARRRVGAGPLSREPWEMKEAWMGSGPAPKKRASF